MGRLLVSLSFLGLLGMSLGCHHTAGICDCDPRTYACRTGPESYNAAPVVVAPAMPQAEPIKQMPKGD